MRYIAKKGIAQGAWLKLSTTGGIAPFLGAASLPEKETRNMGVAAIVLQYRAIWGHYDKGMSSGEFASTLKGSLRALLESNFHPA